MNAEGLRKSDQLVSLDNRILLVQSNTRIAESMVMYNFEIADYHTYAVSDEQVWVHNCGNLKGEWLPLNKAAERRISDVKKQASNEFRAEVKGSKKTSHSGQGNLKLRAQSSALEEYVKKNKSNWLGDYAKPFEREIKRLRDRANADRHK